MRAVLSAHFVLGLLAFASGCSTEQQGEKKSTVEVVADEVATGPNSNALLEVPRPDPTTMEAEVARVMEQAWQQLQTSLADQSSADSVRAQAYADFGLIAFGNGSVLAAEAAFENATRLAPDDARWVYFRALLQEYAGKLDAAAASFERVLELRPNDLPSLLRLADVRFEQAQLDTANTLYQQALGLEADSAYARYGLGRVARTMGNNQQAVEHFDAVLAQQPYADQVNYLLGLTWRNLGDKDKAKSYLAQRGTTEPSFSDPLFDEISGGEERIGGLWADMDAGSQAFVDGNYTEAVSKFRLATQNHPEDSRSWQSLGMSLNKTGDLAGAEAAYGKALELAQNSAVIRHELAKLLIAKGNSKEAEQHLLQAIKIDPQMLEVHVTLARLLSSTGRRKAALQRYQDALALDPQSGDLAISQAETLIALKRTDEAISLLRKTVDMNPKDTSVRMAYGLILADAGKPDLAKTELQQALESADNDPARGRAHYALGRMHLSLGDGSAAIAAFERALKLNPDHRAAGLELARTLVRARDFQRALGVYEVYLGRWPQNDSARMEAAQSALMLGDGAKAKALLAAAAQETSASARLLGSYARLLVLTTDSSMRDPQQALQLAERALQKSPSAQHAETLALCHAAAGSFALAVELQETVLAQASGTVTANVRSRMENNLARYRNNSMGRLPFDTF